MILSSVIHLLMCMLTVDSGTLSRDCW